MFPLELLKKNEVEIKERFGVKRIGVFGSYARQEQKKDSDIDIFVDLERSTFDNYMELLFYLEGLLGKEIDLITQNGISPYLKQSVLKEVVWC
jgi:uncharacterized protein